MHKTVRQKLQKQYESPGRVTPPCYDLTLRDGFKMLNGIPLDENDIEDYYDSLDDNTDFFNIQHHYQKEPEHGVVGKSSRAKGTPKA